MYNKLNKLKRKLKRKIGRGWKWYLGECARGAGWLHFVLFLVHIVVWVGIFYTTKYFVEEKTAALICAFAYIILWIVNEVRNDRGWGY